MAALNPIILFSSKCKPLLRQIQPIKNLNWIECSDTQRLEREASRINGVAAIVLDDGSVLDDGELISRLLAQQPAAGAMVLCGPDSPLMGSDTPNQIVASSVNPDQFNSSLANCIKRFRAEEAADIRDRLARR